MIGTGSQYDAGQVEELKKTLLQTLKYSANIHNLKPDDSVAITVFGQPATVAQVRKSRSRNEPANPLRTNSAVARATASANRKLDLAQAELKARAGALDREATLLRASAQGTVLTLRAKKSDVDAFASGKMDFDGFQKKTEQNSYSGNGYGITSINSWSKTRGASGGL
jgi:hypothetical protein